MQEKKDLFKDRCGDLLAAVESEVDAHVKEDASIAIVDKNVDYANANALLLSLREKMLRAFAKNLSGWAYFLAKIETTFTHDKFDFN